MAEMTREQVLAEAKRLGIVHDKRAKSEAILKLITSLTGEENTIKKKKAIEVEGILRCIIHSQDRENDEAKIEGSVNGEYYEAPIGVEIQLPKKFIPSIKDAVVETKISVLDEEGKPTGKTQIKKYPRFIIEAV